MNDSSRARMNIDEASGRRRVIASRLPAVDE